VTSQAPAPSVVGNGRPSPTRVLLAAGWLTREDAAVGAARTETLGRWHTVHRVTAPDGRTAFVKEGARSGGPRSLFRELYVYRLAAWQPAIAAVLPRALLIDEAHQVLALEAVGPGDSWPGGSGPGIDDPGIASKLAAALAAIHAATTGLAMPRSLCDGILGLPEALADASSGRAAATQTIMRMMCEDVGFSAALREARSLYRPTCLVHGDLRRDNWALEPDGALKLFDWEIAGLGDPEWDVASVISEALVDLVRRGAASSTGWPEPVATLAAHFLRTYMATARSSRSSPLDVHSPARIALFAAARLLHVASEWAECQTGDDPGAAAALLEQARGLLRRDITSTMRDFLR
jgi:hypothetical protein